ncbi:LacI family DNA-binding transcriptional regulator [Amaricoccus sp.]|uniref:LacI family DNA-binding transcriptional regulator n=1 Tax=Amaricoccus sp. TaxID=1872485 RepID=UPI001B5A5F23|nr:LacI family DNA-binding transcriptional regulator [Amaricoccus sp.]MBP7002704.1 LacI family DNA-binding transcriptional regulator [Amaricoccus sp.]
MAKATARDVAAAAGVSPATVDRVLNGRGGVAPEKERRVLEAARRLRLDRALDQRAARTLRVAVLIQPRENPFHAAVQAAFEAANRDFPHLNMQFRISHIAPAEPARTARAIAALAPEHDALVLCSAQDDGIAAAVARVTAEGKPVIALATDIRGGGARTYVGPDNRQAGRVAGDLMGRLLGPGGGEVVMIAGMLSMAGHEERETGFRAVLGARYPRVRLLEVLQSLEQGRRAGDLVFAALKAHPGIAGVYNASAGAQPVVDAIRAAGRSGVVFVTHELTEERRQLLREGRIDAIIDQNPELEVRTAVEVIAAHFGRLDAPPPATVTPVRIYMRENC